LIDNEFDKKAYSASDSDAMQVLTLLGNTQRKEVRKKLGL